MKKGKVLFIVGKEIQGVSPVIEFLEEKGFQVITPYSHLEIVDIIRKNPDLILCITKIVLDLADFDGDDKNIPDNLGISMFPLTGISLTKGIKGFAPDLPIWALEIHDIRDKISDENLEKAGIEEYFDFGNEDVYKGDNYFSLLDKLFSEIEKLQSA